MLLPGVKQRWMVQSSSRKCHRPSLNHQHHPCIGVRRTSSHHIRCIRPAAIRTLSKVQCQCTSNRFPRPIRMRRRRARTSTNRWAILPPLSPPPTVFPTPITISINSKCHRHTTIRRRIRRWARRRLRYRMASLLQQRLPHPICHCDAPCPAYPPIEAINIHCRLPKHNQRHRWWAAMRPAIRLPSLRPPELHRAPFSPIRATYTLNHQKTWQSCSKQNSSRTKRSPSHSRCPISISIRPNSVRRTQMHHQRRVLRHPRWLYCPPSSQIRHNCRRRISIWCSIIEPHPMPLHR